MSLRCRVGIHQWADDWYTPDPACTVGRYTLHFYRPCTRPGCTARQDRFAERHPYPPDPDEYVPELRASLLPKPCMHSTDPDEYLNCPRWRAFDPECREETPED